MRKIVPWIIAVALACAWGMTRPSAAPGAVDPTLAGTWTMKVDFNYVPDPAEPGVTIPFRMALLQNFTQDGRTIELLPTGPGHPNVGDTRVGCMGEWRVRPGRGPHEFDLAMKCMYDQNWDGIYGEIRGIVDLDRKGQALVAEFSYIDYNADGTVFYDQGRGVMYGTRFDIDGR